MWSCAPLCLSRRVTVDPKPTNTPPPPKKNTPYYSFAVCSKTTQYRPTCILDR